MLVVLSGLPGTGKSELAAQLGRRLHIPVLSVDPIESAILRAGITPSFETGLAAYLVVEAIADMQLGLGHGAIVDAVNSVEPAKDLWRKLVARHGLGLRVVECVCSVEALHRARPHFRAQALLPTELRDVVLQHADGDGQKRREALRGTRARVGGRDGGQPIGVSH